MKRLALSHSIDDERTQRAVRSLEEQFRDLTGSPPTVSGSTGGNAALASLLAALELLGLIIDETE